MNDNDDNLVLLLFDYYK